MNPRTPDLIFFQLSNKVFQDVTHNIPNERLHEVRDNLVTSCNAVIDLQTDIMLDAMEKKDLSTIEIMIKFDFNQVKCLQRAVEIDSREIIEMLANHCNFSVLIYIRNKLDLTDNKNPINMEINLRASKHLPEAVANNKIKLVKEYLVSNLNTCIYKNCLKIAVENNNIDIIEMLDMYIENYII